VIPEDGNSVTVVVLWAGAEINFLRVPESIDVVYALCNIPSVLGQTGLTSIDQCHNAIKSFQFIVNPRATKISDVAERDVILGPGTPHDNVQDIAALLGRMFPALLDCAAKRGNLTNETSVFISIYARV